MQREPLISSNLTPQRHGFFGRRAEVSSGLYSSLNCRMGSDDQKDLINQNRDSVAKTLTIAPANLLSLHQIHSNTVIVITDAKTCDTRPKADAMVCALPNIGLGILTADCAPILFCDPDQKIIGAAHAGWKGAIAGIVGNTVEAMVKLGAKRKNIRAVIGPTISQQAYEVGQEFFETFHDDNPLNSRFFINGKPGKYLFDLPEFVITELNNQRIQSAEWVNKCTYMLENKYFSYRRATHQNQPDYERQISVITNIID